MKGQRPVAILPRIQQVKADKMRLVFIGEDLPGGVYILRFVVAQRFTIPCGSFDGGTLVTFEPGNYLYVGSAMAAKGPSSLAGRLTRHASRLDNRPAHAIRGFMMAQFRSFGLGHYEPGGTKNPRWNVDWPLNEMSTTLTAAYAIRTLWKIEGHLAKFLENDDATVVFKRGLGGNDFTDTTHLLRVDADETWWDCLPGKLAAFLSRGQALAMLTYRLGDQLVTPTVGSRLSNSALKYLRGRWHGRQTAIVKLVRVGNSFNDALKKTEHVYDTTRAGKVPSRLSRGRGSVLLAAYSLEAHWETLIEMQAQRTALVSLVKEIQQSVRELRRLIRGITKAPRSQPAKLPLVPKKKYLRTFGLVEGSLKQCRRFARKNINDVPLLEKMIDTSLTASQLSTILNELDWIESGVDRIIEICSSRELPLRVAGVKGMAFFGLL